MTRRQVGVGAVVAVLAVGLLIPLLREAELPAEEAPAVLDADVGRATKPLVYDVDFADERHGYALWGRCTDGRDFRCERKLLVTRDGRHWDARDFAEEELAAPERLAGRITSLGAGRIVLSELGGANERFFSDDGGRSWRVVPSAVRRSVPEIPPEAILETRCVATAHNNLGQCAVRRVVVTLPESGEPAWLATEPALTVPVPERRPAADGSWWVTGRDQATGRWAVAVSRDGGRTWPVALLPVTSGLATDRLSVAGTGSTMYALAAGARPDVMEPTSLVAVFASTDGGASWAQTWQADGKPPRTIGGSAVVTPDGALFVVANDVGPAYRSRDGGHTFAAVTGDPRLTGVRRTRAGYLAVAPGATPSRYLSSVDGVRWSELSFPL